MTKLYEKLIEQTKSDEIRWIQHNKFQKGGITDIGIKGDAYQLQCVHVAFKERTEFHVYYMKNPQNPVLVTVDREPPSELLEAVLDSVDRTIIDMHNVANEKRPQHMPTILKALEPKVHELKVATVGEA